uniref:Uncharacterized protein n=1 Tax=Myoviridae sp. ctCo31 TaxID=2825053 RepID=A0A8S5UMN2_9CAUD|nr:MAG TPA: hypothetical protein [Myoviridae sp. ctCo31]
MFLFIDPYCCLQIYNTILLFNITLNYLNC